jgi:hypothetical protein
MTIPAIVTAVANSTTAFSALGLLIHIFGDPDNSVWDNNIKAWLAKSGLSVIVCGAIANVLTLSSPATSEIVLNCGMSLTFFWLNWWQWEMFKEMQLKTRKKAALKRKANSKPKPKRQYERRGI